MSAIDARIFGGDVVDDDASSTDRNDALSSNPFDDLDRKIIAGAKAHRTQMATWMRTVANNLYWNYQLRMEARHPDPPCVLPSSRIPWWTGV